MSLTKEQFAEAVSKTEPFKRLVRECERELLEGVEQREGKPR